MTNNNTKKTIRDYYNELLSLGDVQSNNELVEFINGRLAQLDKKNSAPRKATAAQVKSAALQASISDYFNANPAKVMTISDMIANIPDCAGLSTSMVRSAVSKLIEAGLMERFEEKRKAYFQLVKA